MIKVFLPLTLLSCLFTAGCILHTGLGPTAGAVRGQSFLTPVSHHAQSYGVKQQRFSSEPVKLDGKVVGYREPDMDYLFVPVSDETALPPASALYEESRVPNADHRRIYRDSIQPRDQLEIRFTDASERSPFYRSGAEFIYGPVEVPADGVLTVPYVEDIQVLGKRLSDLSRELGAMASEVSNSVEVAVRRVERLPLRAFVTGGVHEPGTVVLDREGFTLLDVLSSAGGAVESEHLFQFVLNRDGADFPLSSYQLLRGNLLAQDGDVLRVKRDHSRAFQVLGAVKNTGRFEFPDDSPTLMEAMALCGGLDGGNSNPNGVFVFRQYGSGEQVVYGIDMMDPEATFLAHNFFMAPGDVLYVSESPLQQYKRVMTIALPAVVLAAAAAR